MQAGQSGWRLITGVRSPTGLALVVLCGITLAFYHNLWLPDLVLIKRDAFWFHLPIKQYLIERLSAGELPQWIPYEGLGRPFIGATATGVFHPFTALYSFLSVPDAYRTSTLLSCLLAAFGAFALGRRLDFSPSGALLAGVAFALSGYVVSLTDNLEYLYAICALPLFCASLEQALVKAWLWTVAPAAVWATVFLNGDVQLGYYYGFIALLWMGTRASGSYREASLKLVLIGTLTVLLAGIQLGPAAEVFANSNRTQAALFQEQVLSWSTHPLRLLTLLASPVGTDTDPAAAGRFFFGSPNYGLWAESLYLGIPVMGLAFLGAWQRRDLRVLALLGGVALLLALGRYGGLYEIFYHIVPLWSAFRYPEKLMGVVSFAAAMLAGAGLDTLRAGQGRPSLWLSAAAFSAVVGLGLRTNTAGSWATEGFKAPEAVAHAVTGSAGVALLYSSLAALGMWLVVTAANKGALRREFLLACVVALAMFDLARANHETYHTGPAKAATFIPAFVKTLTAREGILGPGRFRLISTTQSETAWPEYLHRRLGYHGAVSVARRQALDLGHNASFHIETVHPYLPGYSGALAIMLQQQPNMKAEARLNVRYYVGHRFRLKEPSIALALVSELPDYDLALFRNPVPVKPRAYLSRQPERTAAPVDPAALLARSDFLNGDVDVIETSAAQLPGPPHEGTATIERYAPEEVRVRVETAQPAVLILLDSFDKGWTAALENGTTFPILRANALVRAVVVPAGNHAITFWYETPLLRAGAALSLAGTAICLAMIAHSWRRARHNSGLP